MAKNNESDMDVFVNSPRKAQSLEKYFKNKIEENKFLNSPRKTSSAKKRLDVSEVDTLSGSPRKTLSSKNILSNQSRIDILRSPEKNSKKYPVNENDIDYVLSTPHKKTCSKKNSDNEDESDYILSSPRKSHRSKKYPENKTETDNALSSPHKKNCSKNNEREADYVLSSPRKSHYSKVIVKEYKCDEMDLDVISSSKIRTPKARKSFKTTNSESKVLSKKAVTLKTPTKPKVDAVDVNGDVNTPTRYSLRQRMKQELASMNTAVIDSDPEDSDENKSWEDDSGSDSHSVENAATPSSTPRRRKKQAVNCFAENYFTAQKKSKTATSNRTLSKVNFKQTDVEELSEMFKSIPENHKKEKASLLQYHSSLYNKWMHLLQENFNIMLYGIGSKQRILQKFCKDLLQDSLYVVFHGFFPTITIKQILCTITEDALHCETKFSNVYDQAEYIKSHFLKSKSELFIIIHSIDASTLRSEKCQSILSPLATVPKIHFLASVDHINCSLIWDQITLSQFNWIWFDCTTFEPYIAETSYENNILRDQSSHLYLSSLLHVYHSLTPNGQGVFLILAKHQNSGKDSSSYLGIMFPEWYQQCREAFLVNSEITMQAQLSEFKNHKLLASRKSADSIEHWYIPVDSTTLAQFLESC